MGIPAGSRKNAFYRYCNCLSEPDALTSIGEIERISGNDGIDRFDGNAAEHYHMQCCKCGRLIDLKAKDTAAVEQLRKVINTTFDVTGENITVTTTLLQGVCDQCADTEN